MGCSSSRDSQSVGGLLCPSDLAKVVAFDYEVDIKDVQLLSQTGNRGQGIYNVAVPNIDIDVRYDRMGSVYMRHSSAPQPYYSTTPQGKKSNHAVIKFAAADNKISVNDITMIKMQEQRGSGIFHLNINGDRVVYKKFGTVFMKAGTNIPGLNVTA